MKDNNLIADIVFGIIFFLLGYYFVFQRNNMVNALIESNRVFWGKIGINPNQARAAIFTKFMIPVIGLTFLFVSCILLYRAVSSVF